MYFTYSCSRSYQSAPSLNYNTQKLPLMYIEIIGIKFIHCYVIHPNEGLIIQYESNDRQTFGPSKSYVWGSTVYGILTKIAVLYLEISQKNRVSPLTSLSNGHFEI